MNIVKLHILYAEYVGNNIFFTVEVTEGVETFTTYTKMWGKQQVQDICNDNDVVVTYAIDTEDLEESLNQLTLGYIEVQINADQSGEHDVNKHTHELYSGRLIRDFEGKHLKTYVREQAALNFAKKFGMQVVLT